MHALAIVLTRAPIMRDTHVCTILLHPSWPPWHPECAGLCCFPAYTTRHASKAVLCVAHCGSRL